MHVYKALIDIFEEYRYAHKNVNVNTKHIIHTVPNAKTCLPENQNTIIRILICIIVGPIVFILAT